MQSTAALAMNGLIAFAAHGAPEIAPSERAATHR